MGKSLFDFVENTQSIPQKIEQNILPIIKETNINIISSKIIKVLNNEYEVSIE